MVVASDSSRRRFGLLLRNHRLRAGMTQQEMARAAFLSQSTVSSLESGEKGTKREQVERLDAALTANGTLVNSWDAHFAPHGMIDYFREVAEAEQTATEIRQYGFGVVPGLVQTEGYARVISRMGSPHASPEKIEAMVKARRHRQSILDREHPPMCVILLDESTVMRAFSDPDIMYAQINRLLELSYRPRITIQLVPMLTEQHPGLDGSFKLLAVPDSGDFAYIEGRGAGLTIKEPEIVQGYERVFGELRSAALPLPASRARLEEIRGEAP
ncbi:helix-turn-helix transcriptional regulator [Nocardiopsis sp. N85]|uniref:helix-turn-helix domain-containing protein n=1 Tax=Nocardiopsis sp. N85 TaxID=3029400 RepID=UPI00237FB2D2|nr:helix-turn-helix transcriptional regulator [Nocardiopsis sp. N85]MDE3723809.1 helix-turn-helix transcriptional regulator [Nocardiopsis sp. N85]